MKAKTQPLTKPGKNGTLYRYAIEYVSDPGSPTFTWRCWAYSFDHAFEKFHENDEGFEIVRWSRVNNGPASRQTWTHNV